MVLRSLATLTAANDVRDPPEVDISLVILADVEHAAHTLRALSAVALHPGAGPLSGALRDELELLRRRVLAGLAVRHDEEALERVSVQLERADSRTHALAMEWLDVSLTGTDRSAVALLEPGLSDQERLRRLARALPLADLSLAEVLRDLVFDDDHRWRQPWVRACALHACQRRCRSWRRAPSTSPVRRPRSCGRRPRRSAHVQPRRALSADVAPRRGRIPGYAVASKQWHLRESPSRWTWRTTSRTAAAALI